MRLLIPATNQVAQKQSALELSRPVRYKWRQNRIEMLMGPNKNDSLHASMIAERTKP